ncbi:hypothetical protein TIFTF001_034656 [Ficus carica]|uniref:Uncharacterized protein n=1 Tax=Ficus carica TaxID=3494 RepID=A0AA88E8A7_FICCA|nr:hypothetical protein TIFTF001_034656 [Ficus carica]
MLTNSYNKSKINNEMMKSKYDGKQACLCRTDPLFVGVADVIVVLAERKLTSYVFAVGKQPTGIIPQGWGTTFSLLRREGDLADDLATTKQGVRRISCVWLVGAGRLARIGSGSSG